MARKNDGLIVFLTELPWWVSVIVAGVVYVGMRWILPSMEFSNPMLRSLAAATPNVAWIFGLLFLFPALISFFKGKLTSMDRVKAPAPANGAALNVSTGAQSSPTPQTCFPAVTSARGTRSTGLLFSVRLLTTFT